MTCRGGWGRHCGLRRGHNKTSPPTLTRQEAPIHKIMTLSYYVPES